MAKAGVALLPAVGSAASNISWIVREMAGGKITRRSNWQEIVDGARAALTGRWRMYCIRLSELGQYQSCLSIAQNRVTAADMLARLSIDVRAFNLELGCLIASVNGTH
jgi:hypothetical protein